uniref:Reverse transcriptase Ty1/copia-type domain-containing protein n=1 Tax=Peronospora matthiolae TaxID=2874970 RepID=A0AAV1U804_9STRA
MDSKHVPVYSVRAITIKDPKNYHEETKDPRAKYWKEVMRTEIDALEQNYSWEVIRKPREAKLLHSKWVYKLKMHADGTIERYKARLVARGDERVYGIDYTYTFSTILEIVSGKLILAVSRIWGVPAQHGDVPSAYVKAEKDEGLEILLHILKGTDIEAKLLDKFGVQDKGNLALTLKRVCMDLNSLEDCGT